MDNSLIKVIDQFDRLGKQIAQLPDNNIYSYIIRKSNGLKTNLEAEPIVYNNIYLDVERNYIDDFGFAKEMFNDWKFSVFVSILSTPDAHNFITNRDEYYKSIKRFDS